MRLRDVKKMPWALLHGDRSANLDSLRDGAEPEEPTTWKIWTLDRLGFPRDTLLDGLELMSQISWSQISSEHGHQPLSVTMKLHRHLSELMLRTRSTLGLMRPLFQVTEDEKIEYRIMEELAALRRKVPSRSAARHMYCRDLLNLAAAQQQAGRRVSKGIGKRIVAKHGIMWQELDDQRKEMYEKQAVEYSDAKRQGIVDDIGTTRAGLIEHRKQAVERKTLDAPVRVSHCRFSEGEILEFNTLWESARFSNTSVLELQIAACVPVQPPDPAVLDILDAFPGKLKELVPRRLPWLSYVARHREFFRNTCLLVKDSRGERYLKFICASQNPSWVIFLDVQPDDTDWWDVPDAGAWNDAVAFGWRHTFRFHFGSFVHSDSGDFEEDCEIEVLDDVHWRANHRLASDADWRPWPVVVALLGPLNERNPPRERPLRRGDIDPVMFLEHPWLLDIVAPARRAGDRGPGGGGAADGGPGDDGGGADEGDDVLDAEAIMDILHTMRAEWGAAVPEELSMHFKCDARGGLWTAARTGMAVDSIRALCHSQAAKDWAHLYYLRETATFSLRLYQDDHCRILSQYWCHRMGHFFGLRTVALGEAPRRYTPADSAAFVEHVEFSELANNADGALAARIAVLRGLAPSVPRPP
jgi:hypothetical protein